MAEPFSAYNNVNNKVITIANMKEQTKQINASCIINKG